MAPLEQVPQWLFAFDPAGMATLRTLALLCVIDRARARAEAEARGRAALERENLMLKGEAERLARELAATRARADRLEANARETVARLQQVLAAGA